ncbi:MAG: hypothetical protein RJA22_136 [Verrucomicrobiota bacterium]|jgi:hypothetical protein
MGPLRRLQAAALILPAFLAAGATQAAPAAPISFRNDVQPVLAKAGCSSGACHGAAAGQGGFRLSLRGYDDDGDWRAITRSALGRRLVPSAPEQSLLLTKPTGEVPHKGGQRFEVGSPEYRILADWIAAGSPPPRADEPRIQQLDIEPAHLTLSPGATRQFQVRARFTDGSVRDVTRWAKFSDANASVTQIDEQGGLKVTGFGEGAVTAWYLSRIAIARVTVPHTNRVPATAFSHSPRRNFIDDHVLAKLRELNLPPSPRASDTEFIRRAHLDTVGTLPTAAEVRAFLADAGAGPGGTSSSMARSRAARDRLIESLLGRPEFVDYWTYKWSDLLLVSSDKLRPSALWSYHHWIRRQVAANTPWDQLVRDLLTARGSTLENGAANFYTLHEDPPSLAETATQAFLAMSINCARCHNHPMEKWTNDEYWAFANLFARTRTKAGGADGERIVFATAEGDINQPLRGRPQAPRPLDGPALDPADPSDRREALAAWLTAPANPYFTRAIVNRVWANFFGLGLVDPVDDLRATNPASNEELLGETARFLAGRKFDLRALMRAILQSETYQRSSQPLPGNAADTRFHSRYYPRRLMGEVLLDAYAQVTGVPTEFRTDLRNQNRGLGDRYPAGLRALQLPDTRIFSYFLDTFGRPDREKTCACERATEPTMAQALHLANGDTLNQKLAAKGGRLAQLLQDHAPDESILDELYLGSLARYPTPAERDRLRTALRGAGPEERRAVLEDIYWAVLSSREFLFNH